MTNPTWTPARLAELADAEEVVLVISRADRADLRLPVWPVVVDGEPYVPSHKGVTSGWHRGVVDAALRILPGS